LETSFLSNLEVVIGGIYKENIVGSLAPVLEAVGANFVSSGAWNIIVQTIVTLAVNDRDSNQYIPTEEVRHLSNESSSHVENGLVGSFLLMISQL
jgi:hypothetical protein